MTNTIAAMLADRSPLEIMETLLIADGTADGHNARDRAAAILGDPFIVTLMDEAGLTFDEARDLAARV